MQPSVKQGLGALALSLFVLLAMPLVFAIMPLVFGPRAYGTTIMWLGPLGAVIWIAAMVFAIRAIIVAGRAGESAALGWVSVVLSVLALATGAAGWAFGFLLVAGGGPHGRPFRVRGRKLLAERSTDRGWIDPEVAPALDGLDEEARAALAERFTREALEEHASIPAFAQLSLDLVALGAPPELIARAHRAALEEIEHARLCFSLASAYAGRAIGPGPLGTTDAARVLRESVRDGLIGEGLAAERARREVASDPTVAAVLARIAREESEHSLLGRDVAQFVALRGD